MADQNTTTEQVSEDGNGSPELAEHKKVYPELDDAKAVSPPSPRFKVYTVTDPDGAKVYCWRQNTELAISLAARAAGWQAVTAEPKTGKVDPAAVVAGLSDEQLVEMLAARGLKLAKGKK